MTVQSTPRIDAQKESREILNDLKYMNLASLGLILFFAFMIGNPLANYAPAAMWFVAGVTSAMVGRVSRFASLRYLDRSTEIDAAFRVADIGRSNAMMYLGVLMTLASIVAFVCGWIFGFSKL